MGLLDQEIVGGTVSVELNDSIGPYLQSSKGVLQDDPYLLSFLNIGVDCLTKKSYSSSIKWTMKGLVRDLIPNGASILQYGYDTIPCLEENPEYDLNHKLLLYLSEVMPGLKNQFPLS